VSSTNRPILSTSDLNDKVDFMDATDVSVLRVYWFGATDYGGGSANNFLTNVLDGGRALGEVWSQKRDLEFLPSLNVERADGKVEHTVRKYKLGVSSSFSQELSGTHLKRGKLDHSIKEQHFSKDWIRHGNTLSSGALQTAFVTTPAEG
jgi:hypothetical protein